MTPKGNPFFNNDTQLGIDLCLIVAVTLVGFRVVAKLSRKGDTQALGVFKVAMVTSSASIDEVCPLKVADEFSNFPRHGENSISQHLWIMEQGVG